MAGLFEIREGLVNDYERQQFECRESGKRDDVWGVWDWDKGEWRRPANYTRQEAATMSRFLNRNRP